MTRRILLNAYFYGRPSGFGRFLSELCRALGNSTANFEYFAAIPDDLDVSSLPVYPNLRWHPLAKANLVIWDQLSIPRLARQLSCDLVHFPCNTTSYSRRGFKLITTVHDLLFFEIDYPVSEFKNYIFNKYSKLSVHHLLKKSSHIVSVSSFTQELLSEIGFESSVVYNTVDGFVSAFPLPGPRTGPPYFLHRGGNSEHKNTRAVLDAFRATSDVLPQVKLKVLGVPMDVPAGQNGLRTIDDPRIEFLDRVSEQEMSSLYAGCSAVLVTSLKEGFGLPIVEGFGFGCPVITSDLEPMREIAGGAALLVDPYDTDAISHAMMSVITDGEFAAELRSKGHARLRDFSSERMAQQLEALYADSFAPNDLRR